MLIDIDQPDYRTYPSRGNPKRELLLTLGGGIFFCIVVIFLFIGLLNQSGNHQFQPGIIGGLSVVPIMLIVRGLTRLRLITKVTIDPDAIALESLISFKAIPWTDIHRIQKKERSSFMGER